MKQMEIKIPDDHKAAFSLQAAVFPKSYLCASGKNQLGDLLLVTAVKGTGFLMKILEMKFRS